MDIAPSDLGDWRYGLHPDGPGAVIGQMKRLRISLGEALRLEMTNFGSAGIIHVQYFIAAASGALALWTSCAPSQLAERLAQLEAIEPPASLEGRAIDGGVQPAEAKQRA